VSSNLAAGKSLELVESLKATVEEIAGRAAKLKEDYRVRSGREKHRSDTAIEEQNRQLAAALVEAETAVQTAKAAAETKYQRRKTWIGRAYQASKEQALKRVEEDIGARKYELQKRMLQGERDRDKGLAEEVARFEQFRQHLAAEEASLAQLEGGAQKAFRGSAKLRKIFFRAYEQAASSQERRPGRGAQIPAEELPRDEDRLLAELRKSLEQAGTELRRFGRFWLLRIFRYVPVWLVVALGALGAVPVLQHSGHSSFSYDKAAMVAAGIFVLATLIHFVAVWAAVPLGSSLSKTLARARRLHDTCFEQSGVHHQQEFERVKAHYEQTAQTSDQELKQALAKAGEQRVSRRMQSDERTVRLTARHEQMHRARLQRLEAEFHEAAGRLRQATEVRIQALTESFEKKQAQLNAEHDSAWQALEAEWKQRLDPIYQALDSTRALAEDLFPSWQAPVWANWSPPPKFAAAAQFAELKVDVEQLCETVPNEKGLTLPGPARFAVPLCLAYPQQGSILFETASTGHDRAIGALNNVILRLLSVSPPGRLNFTILDPVGLGQNFAGVMHLADYEEQLINSRIWTQSTQFEQRLADLNEYMEKVIQMYLRNEYQTIAEYNEQAGVIAEKYHFLVIADFPSNFTETAAKRLLSIAASGARCGVYMLVHWDQRQPLPEGFIPDELRKACVCLSAKIGDFVIPGHTRSGAALALDAPPGPEQATEFIHQVGRCSRDSSRVEVPFEHVIPAEAEIWSEETSGQLRVPIGRTGATKLQYLAIGKGTRQHGLIAGKTGSGKSTLFHVIITNLALWASPEQVEFYLVDFKKGVEFKCYAAKRLPHARVVAIESDREFGLSVLQRVDDELKRRGDLFRQLGVQDVAGYKRAGGTEPMPRTLLMIDEFQEYFIEDDKVSQTASLLLDRIVRQGRAFGIHVLLGSQTLGGAYTVARTTLGQMVIRIALQCNEADAYLIMDDSNPAPRLLSRPGEGIYNDMAGALQGNSPFQVVWLPDEVRDKYLEKARAHANASGVEYPGPIVFEGNAPADVRENHVLRGLLEAASLKPATAGRIWLGAPNSIKGPTEAVFHRQSGNNLLVVGQRDEATVAMLAIGLISLTAQYPPGGARIIFCDATPPGTPQREVLEKLVGSLPQPIPLAKPGDLPQIMKELGAEMKTRAEAVDPDAAPPVFLIIHDLQKFSRLRFEEDFGFSSSDSEAEANPAAVLNELICEGTRLGFHVIATCDTYNNVSRFLSRKALSEFEMRVLFQMSANDSASLIDSPKAGMLGLHRALFYNAQEGYLETFRPYAMPGKEWLEQAMRNLARLGRIER
jgi:DNA segregation ATPase FtsK/SpoIIIE-like protein